MQTNSRYVLVGGSGFLGRRLRDRLVGDGAEVVVLGRSDGGRGERWRSVRWDPTEVGMWAGELEGAAAVVVLAGRRVDVRPTTANVDELISSRVESVRTIGRAIADLTTPPASWIQLSSLAIFGDAGDDVLDESSPIAVDGPRQQVDVCRQWESAFADANGFPGWRRAISSRSCSGGRSARPGPG